MKFHRIWGFELSGIGQNVTNHAEVSQLNYRFPRMIDKQRVLSPLALIMPASRRGMLATKRCRLSTAILVHWSKRAWRSPWGSCGGWFILLIACPNSSHRCSMGIQSGYCAGRSILVLLLQIISLYSGTMRHSIVIFVENIISKVLPSKW